jgi:hypothetical protein
MTTQEQNELDTKRFADDIEAKKQKREAIKMAELLDEAIKTQKAESN